MKINFIGGHKYEIDDVINAQSCVNLYPIAAKDKTPVALKSTPGISSFLDSNITYVTNIINTNQINTSYDNFTLAYVVGHDGTDTKLHSLINYNQASSPYMGVVDTLAGVTSEHNYMVADSDQIIMCTLEGAVYVIDFGGSDSLTVVSGINATNVVLLDGFFLFRDNSATGSYKILASDYSDGSAINSANYGLVKGKSGEISTLLSTHIDLLVFCEFGIEVWQNAGRPNFPLLRNDSVYIKIGLRRDDEFSVTSIIGLVFFCGIDISGNRAIYILDGYSPSKISTPSIDNYINDKNVSCFAYSRNGHTFLVVHVFKKRNAYNTGNEKKTFVFDVNTGLWHTRKSDNRAENIADWLPYRISATDVWRENGSQLLCISALETGVSNSYIYKLEDDVYQDDVYSGTAIEVKSITRERVSNHIYGNDNRELTHRVIEFDFKPVDATIKLTWSDDNGVTWSNGRTMEITTLNGQARETDLGSSRNRIYKIVSTSNADILLLNVWLNNKP